MAFMPASDPSPSARSREAAAEPEARGAAPAAAAEAKERGAARVLAAASAFRLSPAHAACRRVESEAFFLRSFVYSLA